MLTFEHVRKNYDSKRVLEDCSISFEPGKVYALVGPNGTGKSTLMKAAAGLVKINGGTFSWRRRAVLVKYNGHVYAASIYSEPHGTNTILDNNFDGQFCLHFYGSKTHGTDRVDADHQKCVEQAMKATW